MARNAIKSDFRSSKMAAKSHFVKNSKQITLLATFPHFSPLLVNFSYELGQIMTRYDFLWARWVILSNVRNNLNLT